MRWVLAVCAVFLRGGAARAQVQYARGQDVAPVFEGWERNPDGTFSMVFGYLNRNYQEEVDIPVGPDNTIAQAPAHSPAIADSRRISTPTPALPVSSGGARRLGQATESDLDPDVARATNQAKGWLQPVWELSPDVIVENMGGGVPTRTTNLRRSPSAMFRPSRCRNAATLTASATDDGLPKPYRRTPSNPDRDSQPRRPRGVQIKWIQYRGPGKVTFDPQASAVVYGEPVR
jgi:hypothetical protein